MDQRLDGLAAVGADSAVQKAPWRDRLPSPFATVTGLTALAAGAVIFAPILVMFGDILFPGGTLNVRAFVDTFTRPGIGSAFRNSLIIVVAVNLTAVPAGVLFAWLNFRTDARIGPLTDLLPILPLFLPSVAMAIGWVFLGSDKSGFLSHAVIALLGWAGIEVSSLPIHIFTWPGLLLLYFLEIMPVVYVITGAAFRSVDSALEEAARINGSSVLRTFITVSAPSVRHAILLSMLLASVLAFGSYSIPAIIGTPADILTVSVHLVRLLNGEFPPRFDQATVLSLILITLFGTLWLVQQHLNALSRHAQIGGQGMRQNLILLGPRLKWFFRTLMLGYVALATLLPLIALILVALQPYWTPKIDLAVLGLDNFRELFGDQHSRSAIINSMTLGITTSLVTLLIAAVLMVYAITSGGSRERAVGVLTKVPAAISHLVIAAGLLIAFGGPPLHLAHTVVILSLAYFVLYIPKASIAAEAAFRQVGPQLSEASRICGASGTITFFRVILPLMLPGLAAGWALIFASIVGELTASVILAGPHNPVMGYLIMTIYDSGTYSQLAALATVIAAMSALTVGVTMALARPKFASLGSA